MLTPFLDPALCRDELHDLAARAGVSVEHLCATVESATQFARDSVAAHKVGPNPPYPLYDDDLEAVIRGLRDDDFDGADFANDDFDFQIKQIPWNESDHPRDEDGRFTNGGSAGYSAQGSHTDAGINHREIVMPSVPADKYESPLMDRTAQQALDKVIEEGDRMAAERRLWAAKNNLSEKKLAQARKQLAELQKQDVSVLDETQRALLNHRMTKLRQEVDRHSQIETAERRDIARLRELLYVVDPTTINFHFAPHPNSGPGAAPVSLEHHKNAALSGVEEVRRLVSEKLTMEDIYFEQETNPESRSNYAGDGRIKFAGETGTRVVVHEFGHDLEARNPHIRQKAVDFLRERTKGEPLLKLKDVIPGCREDEVYRKDKFIHPYMGKIYPNMSATEIFSMGLEHFHSDPLALAKGDPDYFCLIFDALRGR